MTKTKVAPFYLGHGIYAACLLMRLFKLYYIIDIQMNILNYYYFCFLCFHDLFIAFM